MKKRNFGSIILRYVIGFLVIGAFGFVLTNGTRFLNENNSMQREAKIALEDYISTGRDLPIGEYVSLEARWVLGPFATETSTSSTNGIKATSGVAYYYFLLLEDETVMALKTENLQEREVLDRMSDWLVSVDGFPMNGETLKVQGKLTDMKDKDLTAMYKEYLSDIFDLQPDDPTVRYLVLDTSSGREQLYLIIVAGIVLLVLAVVFIRRGKKKNSLPPAGPSEAGENQGETEGSAGL